MSKQWFLWPEPRLFRGGGIPRQETASAVEALLASRHHGGFPVVLSSGRIGLVLALEALGITRADLVGLFPYASHCVIEATGRVGSPVCRDRSSDHARILYHQWGYVQEASAAGAIIEDAVDSFCLPEATLFPAGASFEVWSLPKLTGSLGGGVLWCRTESLAAEVRARRDARSGLATFRWLLRAASTRWPGLVPYWYGAESAGGAPPGWGCADILDGLHRWDDIAAARRARLDIVGSLRPSWLSEAEGRLPTAVPVEVGGAEGSRLTALGFTAGFRHFERVSGTSRESVRVFPIPVHQDVPLGILASARSIVTDA